MIKEIPVNRKTTVLRNIVVKKNNPIPINEVIKEIKNKSKQDEIAIELFTCLYNIFDRKYRYKTMLLEKYYTINTIRQHFDSILPI